MSSARMGIAEAVSPQLGDLHFRSRLGLTAGDAEVAPAGAARCGAGTPMTPNINCSMSSRSPLIFPARDCCAARLELSSRRFLPAFLKSNSPTTRAHLCTACPQGQPAFSAPLPAPASRLMTMSAHASVLSARMAGHEPWARTFHQEIFLNCLSEIDLSLRIAQNSS